MWGSLFAWDSHVRPLKSRSNLASQFQNLHCFIDSDASGKKAGLIRHWSSSFIPCIQYALPEALNAG